MITGSLLLLLIVFSALYAIQNYNRLLAIKSDGLSDFFILKRHMTRRYKQIEKIVFRLQSCSEVDQTILKHTTLQNGEAKKYLNDLCHTIETGQTTQNFITADTKLSAAYETLSKTSKVITQSQQDSRLKHLISSLATTERRLVSSSKRYNEEAEQYNRLLQHFPNHFIVFVFQYLKLGVVQKPKPLALLPLVL